MAIYQLDGVTPHVHPEAWIADSAQVMGQVEIGAHASIWFGTVVRGDTDWIRVGAGSNVQDHSVLHTDLGVELVIGERVTVGHRVVLHGCQIGDGALIGIGAIVLNGARIGRNCIVGAGALVTEGKEFADNSMILGAPARAVKTLSDEQIALFQLGAEHYKLNAQRFAKGLVRLS